MNYSCFNLKYLWVFAGSFFVRLVLHTWLLLLLLLLRLLSSFFLFLAFITLCFFFSFVVHLLTGTSFFFFPFFFFFQGSGAHPSSHPHRALFFPTLAVGYELTVPLPTVFIQEHATENSYQRTVRLT